MVFVTYSYATCPDYHIQPHCNALSNVRLVATVQARYLRIINTLLWAKQFARRVLGC